MSVPPIRVSDHGLLRYLERVRGVDVEAARAEVAELIGSSGMLGAACVVRLGHVFVIEAYCVTTVLPKGAHFKYPPGRRGPQQAKRQA